MAQFEIIRTKNYGAIVPIYGEKKCFFLTESDARAFIECRVAERLRLALRLFELRTERAMVLGRRAMKRYHRAREVWRMVTEHTEIAL